MSEIVELPIAQLENHPDNPRLVMREDVINGIASAIKAKGMFDPAYALLVRPLNNNHWQIVRGHHRKEAAALAGLATVPCWVREMNDDEAYMELATSNVQDGMTPLEWGIHALKYVELGEVGAGRGNRGGMQEYAAIVGKDRGNLAKYRKAAETLKAVKNCVILHNFIDKANHLYAISQAHESIWPMLCEFLIEHEWSVTETNQMVDAINELEIPEQWERIFLPLPVIAKKVIDNEMGLHDVEKLIRLASEIVKTIEDYWSKATPKVKEFHQWLSKNRGGDSWRAEGLRSYLEQVKKNIRDNENSLAEIVLQKERAAQNLPSGTYNVILVDPPWQYDNTGLKGAAINHYDTMAIPELCDLLTTIELDVSDDAVLFMWVTAPMLDVAMEVVNAWGFDYKTNIVWHKLQNRIGLGHYVRVVHELLLICTRGSFTPLTKHPISSILATPLREHSRKPDEIYEIIERLYPDCSYIELFARTKRDGWDAWGNEVGKF